jgi:hypothetical protein
MGWPRFQFTIAGLLLFIFWLATSFGAFALATRALREHWPVPRIIGTPLGLLVIFLAFGGPIVAVGALVGRARLAAIIAAALLGAIILILPALN